MKISITPFCFALYVAASQAGAQDAGAVNGTQFGDWQLVCVAEAVNQTSCGLVQSIVENTSQSFVAEIAINRIEVEGLVRGLLSVRTPTSMLLTERPAYRVGDSGEVHALEWRTCSSEFCSAVRLLSSDELEELAQDGPVVFGYQPITTAEPVNFAGSLSGLAEGLNALGFE
mgnify:CR=1 FL=1